MTKSERILEFVLRFPGRDDDEISRLLGIAPRQAVNQACRKLASERRIERRFGESGKLANFPMSDLLATTNRAADSVKPALQPAHSGDATADWFWEGNVTEAIAKFLIGRGWSVLSQADTRTKQQGVDLHVSRNGSELLIEVKGYPSIGYRDPKRAGEKKPTNPSVQASHWFAHALLKALRLRSKHPAATAVMAFPDFPRYRSFFGEIGQALAELRVGVCFVNEEGSVDAVGLPEDS